MTTENQTQNYKKTVFFKTLGCKVNTFDTHALENQFSSRGYQLAAHADSADVIVINSCSVTHKAEKDARYLLRRYEKESPNSFTVITGCYAQTDSAQLVKLPEVDLVVPNETKGDLVDLVESRLIHTPSKESHRTDLGKLPDNLKPVSKNRQGHFKSSIAFFDKAKSAQTRAFLKIQDGCDGFCSYCLIPYARGSSKSVEPSLVEAEVTRLVESGTKEIVFTGIHIGDYGRDLPSYNESTQTAPPFVKLLSRIITTPGLERVRISSLEPGEVSPELIALLATNKEVFCDHFHLPLQSGDDRVLKAMNRKYDTARYRESVELIRSHFPEANITADIIPGFPGETQQEFENSLQFIEEVGLNGLHVFPYSKRPNTAAAKMPGHLSTELVQSRAAQLRELGSILSSQYLGRFLGTKQLVLWENNKDREGRLLGKTTNYLNVASTLNHQAIPGSTAEITLRGLLNPNTALAT